MADDQGLPPGSDDDWLKSAGLSTAAPVPTQNAKPSDAAPSAVTRIWNALTTTPDWLQKPADALADQINAGATGKNPWLDKLRGFAAGALQGATREFANPVGAVSAFAGAPEEAVAAPLAKNLIRGAQVVAGTSGAVEGAKEAADPTLSPLRRVVGAGKGALGALGTILGMKGLTAAPEEMLPPKTYPSTTPAPPAATPVQPGPPTDWPDLDALSPKGPVTRAEQVAGIEPRRLVTGNPTPNPPAATGPRPPAYTDRSVQALHDLMNPGATPEPLELPTRTTAGDEHFDTTPPDLAQGDLPLSGATDQPDLVNVNGSGAPGGGGLEEQGRVSSMQVNGRTRVKYDAAGNRTVIGNGVGSQDVFPGRGESTGIEDADGFHLMDDNGGKTPPSTPMPESVSTRGGPSAPPNRVPAGPAETFDLGSTSEPGAGGGTPVHPAIQALHESLGPAWQKILDAQEGDNIPFTVDPREDLQAFNDRIMSTEDPRDLMGGERKARALAMAGDETGAISPTAALHLGTTALGAVGGSLDQPEHPILGAAVGGTIGALAPALVTHPDLAQTLRYLNLLSSPVTVGKKILGDVGGAMGAGIDKTAAGDPMAAVRLARQLFDPQTARDAYANIKSGVVPGAHATGSNVAPPTGFAGTITPRIYGGITDAVQGAYARAGFTPEEAAHYTFTGQPRTALGKGFLQFAARSGPIGEAVLPFTRVPTNLTEQGIQALPGAAFVPLLAKLAKGESIAPSEWAAAGIKQIPSAVATGVGVHEADEEAQKGTPTEQSIPQRLEDATRGAYNTPVTVGKAVEKMRLATQKSRTGGTPLPDAVAGAVYDTAMPIAKEDTYPSNLLTQFSPAALADLARTMGEEPRSFNTHSTLGPTIARIPGLNEVMLNKSATYKPPPTAATKDDAAWLSSAGIR